MDYGESVQKVLLRKIQKAEQDLIQLKLDYCRFIFGLTHRSKIIRDDVIYLVRSVDVDSMKRCDDGTFSKPEVTGIPESSKDESDLHALGQDWKLLAADTATGSGQ